MSEIGVEVWGSGPAGDELEKILSQHPEVGFVEKKGREDYSSQDGQASFLAIPPGESGALARELLGEGKKVFDLSADLRFKDLEAYEEFYNEHPAPDLLPVTYGLAEVNKEEIRDKDIVSIPGCYPTATLLGTLPLIRHGLIKPDSTIFVDAISGWSGGGKNAKAEEHEDIELYNVGRQHRHVGEMEQFTKGHEIVFTPGVLKRTTRGILSVIKVELDSNQAASDVQWYMEGSYAGEPFVKVLPGGNMPNHQTTVGTDLCVIGAYTTGRTAIVVSNIDNLRKGAASQAVQCFNLAYGFNETAGLTPKSEAF